MEKLIYENPLQKAEDIADFRLEGQAKLSLSAEGLLVENALAASEGQKANYVLWCEEDFPADIRITWEFKPLDKTGLCMLFFAAQGQNGESIFDPGLAPRNGIYKQYHSGDINAFHISYYRRKEPDEKAFHTCNLRKSAGFHLAAMGGDPIPDYYPGMDYFRLELIKQGPTVKFLINELELLHFEDDGQTYGPLLGGGKIGFRTLAPLRALYRNLQVYRLS